MRLRRSRLHLASLLVLGSALVGLGLWLSRSAGDTVAGTLGLVLTAATFALDLMVYLRTPGPSLPPAEDQADELAQVVAEQWHAERQARLLDGQEVLPLRWRQTARSAGAAGVAMTGRLAGGFEQVIGALADGYCRIPGRRLVVLGQPGSGKSVLALLITLGLVQRRAAGGAVPVLLSASSWDPLTETMDAWVVRMLATAYYNGRTETPDRLLRRGLLLPVVDGLDEIPETSRRSAVRAVNTAIGSARPVVVTCRAVEYEDLVRAGAPELRDAPVVEVLPVEPADVIAYLQRVDWPDGVDWAPVHAELRAGGGSPVAAAFGTPLTVSLARQVYQRLDRAPGELLNRGRFDSRLAVEDHLTDLVVDAAYAPDRPRGGLPGQAATARWDATDARRWLTFLAGYLHRHRERDLVWWTMTQRLSSPWVAPAVGVVGGVALMSAVSLWISWFDRRGFVGLERTILVGAAAGVAFAVLATVMWFATAGRIPGRLSFATRGWSGRLRHGFGTGLAVAAVIAVPTLAAVAVTITVSGGWSLDSTSEYFAAAAGTAGGALVVAAGSAVQHWLNAPPERAEHSDASAALRQDRRSALAGAFAGGATVAVSAFGAVVAGLYLGSWCFNAVSGWTGWPGNPDHGALFTARRLDVAEQALGGGALTIGAAALLPGVLFALLTLLTRAWPRFAILRLTLSAQRRLPWALLAFLADARRRDLLREVAGAYQFRHVRLQERLANGPRSGPADPPVRARRPGRRAVAVVTAVATALVAVVMFAVVPDDGARATLAGTYGRGPYSATVSTGGHKVAVYSQAEPDVRVFELGTGAPVSVVRTGLCGVADIALTPNGRLAEIRSACEGDPTEIWDVAARPPVPLADAYTVERLAGGRFLAAWSGPTGPGVAHVTMFDAATGQVVLEETAGQVRDTWGVLRPTTGRTILTGAAAASIVLVDAPTGVQVMDLNAGTRGALAGIDPAKDLIGISPDGRLVYAIGSASIRFWRSADRAYLGAATVPPGVTSAQFNADGSGVLLQGGGDPAVAADDDTLVLVRPEPIGVLATATVAGHFASIEFSGSGQTLGAITVTDDGATPMALRLWRSADGSAYPPMPAVAGYLFVDDTAVVTKGIGERTELQVRNVADATFRSTMSGGAEVPLSSSLPDQVWELNLTVSSGHDTVTDYSGGEVRIWATNTGRQVLAVDGTSVVAVSADGHRLAQFHDGATRIIDVHAGGQVCVIPASWPHDALVDERSGPLASVGIGDVPLTRGPTPPTFREAAFSPDGRRFATVRADGETIQVWDVLQGTLVATLRGHLGEVYAVRFADDRTLISTGRTDATVRIWDVAQR